MKVPYKPPTFKESSFNCPWCNAFAQQKWFAAKYIPFRTSSTAPIQDLWISECEHCREFSIWYNEALLVPEVDIAGIPPANTDLDDEIQRDYNEAASILSKSPRGACALLRLAIEKLCQQLGASGKDLNANIALLVQRGLDQRVQKALDSVRVIGGEAVHPGRLDLRDDRDTASVLFGLVNHIAEEMITKPKAIDKFYEILPQSKREAIEERDASKEE